MLYRSVRLGFLAVIVSIVVTQSVNADIQIALQEDSGPVTLVAVGADFAPTSFSGTYGDFTVDILGGTSNNGSGLSDLLSSTTSVVNNDGVNGHTLKILVSQDEYTLPGGAKLLVQSGLGGTVNIGAVNPVGVFQAYADKGNDPLFPTNVVGSTIAAPGAAVQDFTNGPQNDTVVGKTFDTGTVVGTFTRTADYSVTSVATLAMTAGGNLNYSDQVNVSAAAVPEPGTLAMASLSLPVGLCYWLRKRRNARLSVAS